jgi:hypothetical protein
MIHSNLRKTGVALLLASLGVACGGSDGVSAGEGGPSTDTGGAGEGGIATDGANSADGEDPADGGTTPDAGSAADDGSTADAARASDGEAAIEGDSSSPQPVNLGMAGHFAILAKTGISTVPTSAITGDLGVSPAAATYITGFTLMADSTNVFDTASQVNGKIYAADFAVPTPANLTTAIGDMQVAFTDAAGRTAGVTELGAGNIGGMTLPAGVYKWSTGLLIPSNVTLNGSGTDVWILQVAKDLTVRNAMRVVLTGGAAARNIFWQVSGSTEIGTTAHVEGIVLDQTAITLSTGASINGRLLAQTAVNIQSSVVVQPAP